jgi:hypothetical protein
MKKYAPPFLTSALDGGEWSAFRPVHIIPGEISSDAHLVGGWVGPVTGLNTEE